VGPGWGAAVIAEALDHHQTLIVSIVSDIIHWIRRIISVSYRNASGGQASAASDADTAATALTGSHAAASPTLG
jgi:hypothetical protein